MGILDGPLRGVSASLIAQFGQLVMLELRTTGAYSPEFGSSTNQTTNVTVRGLVEPYKNRFQGQEMPDGARAADLQVTIAAPGLPRAPNVGDGITLQGQKYEVVEVDPTYSGDQAAIYALHVRR